MLTEKRQDEIVKLLREKESVTVQELKEFFQASESTIRRDLTTLHNKGKLVKVFGGAVSAENGVITTEDVVALREERNRDEKLSIARYAAALIGERDFVYLDAGTTTGYMIDFITQDSATYVTNAVSHAQRLAKKGFQVILIGGELKAMTEAVVGSEAVANVEKYHFSIGFFGTNGISRTAGFTTLDIKEAAVKRCAMEHSLRRYVLGDGKKFDQIAPVSFGNFYDSTILTDKIPQEGYAGCVNLIEV
ncbi:MAG: DeoR/GlpR family DNA-binding transcription regulator [bacterium]|nr:DeoR/GlpR family DNA-binding transcription regulator [bacterium]